jgi:alpha-L-fucosidase
MGTSRSFVLPAALVLAVVTGPVLSGCGDDGEADPPPIVHPGEHVIPEWFTDAKFGVFIHWGVYSVPAWAPIVPGIYAEWYWFFQQLPIFQQYQYHLRTYGADFVYDDFIPQFRAENWDPADWIRLIEDSGAKYWVLTTKHHDGFALWPTQTSDRNSVKLGPGRDLVGDLIEANRGSDLRVGLYYSLPEWFNPAPKPADIYDDQTRLLFGSFPHPQNPYLEGKPEIPYTGQGPVDDYATGIVIPQIEELIERYRPSILWCDIGGNPDYFQTERWLTKFYSEGARHHPEGVTANNRCGAFGDFATPEYAPIPAPGGRYFEATRGIGNSFGYNRNEQLEDYLSDAEVIHTLIDTVAGGGNLLLDIGPEADGTIPQVMRDRLLAIGRWLEINGEAIYGSRRWSHPGAGTIRYTVGKNGSLYVIAREWPGEELVVEAPIVLTPDAEIKLLGADGTPLAWEQNGARLVVPLPWGAAAAAATRSEHAFVFRISGVADVDD